MVITYTWWVTVEYWLGRVHLLECEVCRRTNAISFRQRMIPNQYFSFSLLCSRKSLSCGIFREWYWCCVLCSRKPMSLFYNSWMVSVISLICNMFLKRFQLQTSRIWHTMSWDNTWQAVDIVQHLSRFLTNQYFMVHIHLYIECIINWNTNFDKF